MPEKIINEETNTAKVIRYFRKRKLSVKRNRKHNTRYNDNVHMIMIYENWLRRKEKSAKWISCGIVLATVCL